MDRRQEGGVKQAVIGIAAAAGLVLALAIPPLLTSAGANIGATSSTLTTNAPDLRTVSIDTSNGIATYCFDQNVSSTVGGPGKFWLLGYDSGSWAFAGVGTVPRRITTQMNCFAADLASLAHPELYPV